MIKVSTDIANMYYVITQVQFGLFAGRFYFKPLKSSTIDAIKTITNSQCNDELFNKYKFNKEDDSVTGLEQYRSSELNVTITCSGKTVSNINNLIADLEEVKEANHIAPNEKAYEDYKKNLKGYISEIDEDYKEWLEDDSKETEVNSGDGFKL